MIDTLGLNVPAFEGAIGHVRCFAHVVNLVAKSMLRQFDVPRGKASQEIEAEDRALYDLANEDEEDTSADPATDDEPLPLGEDSNASSGESADADDGWVDEIAAMTEEEQAQFRERVRPIRMTLTKVSGVKGVLEAVLTVRCRSVASRLNLSTPAQFSSRRGRNAWLKPACLSVSCREMSRRGGTQPTTCWSSQSSTESL